MKYFSEKLLIISSCLIAFGVNMPSAYIPKFIVFWLTGQLLFIIFHFKEFKPFSKSNQNNLLLAVFYLWCIISVFYSENKTKAINTLELRLLLLLVPLLNLFKTQFYEKRNNLIYFFLLGNFASIIIGTIHFVNSGLWGSSEIRLLNFSKAVNEFQHYNYLGLNLSLGLLLLNYLLKNEKLQFQLSILIPVALSYLMFISLSQARISLITIIIVSIIITINKVIQFNAYKTGGIIFVTVSLIFVFFVSNNTRIEKFLKSDEISLEKIDNNRYNIWNESIELFKYSPIVGYGIGDTQINLSENKIYNAHNQFLDFALEGGLISILIFIIAWIFIFFIKIPTDLKFYSIGISIVFFIFFLVESILNRIAGVSSFIFIIYLLRNTSDGKQSIKTKSATKTILALALLLFVSISIITYTITKKVDFNPKNPRTYVEKWFTPVAFSELPGIIPKEFAKGTNGYRIDKTTFSGSYKGNSYSHTLIAKSYINSTDTIKASVFCYVSYDFNGSWVKISSEGSSYSNQAALYNLNDKGSWQRLEIIPKCNSGEVPIFLYMAKTDCTTFDSLKGYVIFAYPEIKINGKSLR